MVFYLTPFRGLKNPPLPEGTAAVFRHRLLVGCGGLEPAAVDRE